jgi:FkbM family methyltransferase
MKLNLLALRTLPVRLTSVYLRTYHWDLARWRLVKYALRQTRAYGSLMGSATVTTHHGFKMALQLHDWVDQHVWATGNYEDITAMTIESLLGAGNCGVDIGANIGFFTLLMAKRVGPQGAVWAFEPSPLIRKRLIHNINLNDMAHVIVREEAVANVDGQRTFFEGPVHNSGQASLRPLQVSNTCYEVRTCRLTSCLPGFIRPRLIKIDIEGAEHLALQGMREILQDHHPDLILEMSNHYLTEMGTSSSEVYAFLREFGYSMYSLEWDGLVAYQNWDTSLPVQFNALFTVRACLPSQLPLKAVVA